MARKKKRRGTTKRRTKRKTRRSSSGAVTTRLAALERAVFGSFKSTRRKAGPHYSPAMAGAV